MVRSDTTIRGIGTASASRIRRRKKRPPIDRASALAALRFVGFNRGAVPVRLSTQDWPFVVTTIVESMDETETTEYLTSFLDQVVNRRTPFVSIVDARRMTRAPSAKVRRMIADWEQANGDLGSRYNRGVAFVTESALIRGAMTALQWISPPRVPTVYEATMESARVWARTQLGEAARSVNG